MKTAITYLRMLADFSKTVPRTQEHELELKALLMAQVLLRFFIDESYSEQDMLADLQPVMPEPVYEELKTLWAGGEFYAGEEFSFEIPDVSSKEEREVVLQKLQNVLKEYGKSGCRAMVLEGQIFTTRTVH